jgi:NADPH-dependent ferric siderophore reductase
MIPDEVKKQAESGPFWPKLMPLTLLMATAPSKRVRRLTFTGELLHLIPEPKPGQWIKIFPDLQGTIRHGRAYTIIDFAREDRTLTIDVTLHGNGVFSRWAASASPGARVESSLPCGVCKVPVSGRCCIFAGDETAAPAILTILQSLPEGVSAQAFIEVESEMDIPARTGELASNICWLSRDAGKHAVGSLLTHAITSIPNLEANDVWLAGEQEVVGALRAHCLSTCGIKGRCLQAAGYWKQGKEEHRDEDGEY